MTEMKAPLAFSKPGSVSGLEFFVFRKTELSETEKAVTIRVVMLD